jgi:pilus assembly protein Flp/PilA
MVLESLRNREDEGQGLVEYGLIIALVAVVCIGALTALGGSVSGVLDQISGSI